LSFARTSSRELVAKRLALLRELVPSTTRVAVLVNGGIRQELTA
jgi:hypothetical protein